MRTSQHLIDSCVCTRLRTAARMATRAYDEALRPADINASQLAILAAIDVDSTTSIGALSKRLMMDRTTLSRNLKPLERERLIELGAEGWKRSKTVQVTKAGRERLALAASLWDIAQRDFLNRFGRANWQRVDRDLRAVAGVF